MFLHVSGNLIRLCYNGEREMLQEEKELRIRKKEQNHVKMAIIYCHALILSPCYVSLSTHVRTY